MTAYLRARALSVLCAALVLASLAAPVFAAGNLPDNLGDLQKGSYVGTDCTNNNNCAPGVRVVPVSPTGGTNQIDLIKVGGNTVAVGATGQIQTAIYGKTTTAGDTALLAGTTSSATGAGFLNVMGGRSFASTDTTVSPTLTDWVGSVGALNYGVYNASLPTTVTGNLVRFQTDVNGRQLVVASGDVASAATDSGNPVKVGCKVNTTAPTFTDGQRGDCQLGTRGALVVEVHVPNGTTGLGTGAAFTDGFTNGPVRLGDAGAYGFSLNGSSTWDRDRSGAVSNVAAATGFKVALDVCQYNATAPAITTTRYNNTQCDVNGNLLVSQAGHSYAHIAAGQATTTVKSGAGFLHNICFNNAATATNTTTVYDNSAGSGTVIAIPAATTATVTNCMTYDVRFGTGLTIVTATANGSDMTVSYD